MAQTQVQGHSQLSHKFKGDKLHIVNGPTNTQFQDNLNDPYSAPLYLTSAASSRKNHRRQYASYSFINNPSQSPNSAPSNLASDSNLASSDKSIGYSDPNVRSASSYDSNKNFASYNPPPSAGLATANPYKAALHNRPNTPSNYTNPQNSQSKLNTLYNIDLLQAVVPPIKELSYPPPPIILPSSFPSSPLSNAPPPYIRSTLNVIPACNSVALRSKLPFAIVLQPYATLCDNDEPINVPLVNDGIICRCKKCKGYINPFVNFKYQGAKWICSLCNTINDTPVGYNCSAVSSYFSPAPPLSSASTFSSSSVDTIPPLSTSTPLPSAPNLYNPIAANSTPFISPVPSPTAMLPPMASTTDNNSSVPPFSNVIKPSNHVELNHSIVEYLAPSEYSARPPQKLVYLFIIDVSASAVQAGLVYATAQNILDSLDKIPNSNKKVEIGFICFDSSIYYFSFHNSQLDTENILSDEGTSQEYENDQKNQTAVLPQMIAVSDLKEPLLPMPTGLLVNLVENRSSIDLFLSKLGNMFTKNVITHNALGSALVAAQKLLSANGGKIVTLTANRPDIGKGILQLREEQKYIGTSKENTLLKNNNSFYKSFAADCSNNQITVDMFLFSSQYQDFATLSDLPYYTGGNTRFYPGWNCNETEDKLKFSDEMKKYLSQDIALEGVMKVRTSTGLNVSSYHGHFYSTSNDTCLFPTMSRDQSFIVELSYSDVINSPTVCIQAAFLHTTVNGERRVRIMTVCLPTSRNLSEIFASADQLTISKVIARRAADKAIDNGIENARNFVRYSLLDILSIYKKELMSTNIGASAPLQLCTNLRLLPLLLLGLSKSVGLRKSARVRSDLRAQSLSLLKSLPVIEMITYVYPNLYSLHDIPDEVGLADKENPEKIVMPQKLNLRHDSFQPHGLYLFDDGQLLFLFLGRNVVPQLIQDVFNCPSIDTVPIGKYTLPVLENDFSIRINAILRQCRASKTVSTHQSCYVIREDGDIAMKLWAYTLLVEDPVEEGEGYVQFLTNLRSSISS